MSGFGMDCDTYQGVNIKVVGVGGCGGNTVNHMITSGMKGVEFIVLNTDRQELKKSMAKYSFNIGQKVTGGRGAGADPDKGRRSAEENRKEITALLKGAHMVFIAAGMGGGTGTGAAPVVAEVARELGILTVAVVTKPFDFDGKEAKAEQGIEELKKHVDSLLVIPNQRMVDLGEKNGADITFKDAKAAVNDVLYDGVRSISDLINFPGFINLDFADVTSIMKDSGNAYIGVGMAGGKNRVRDAMENAINCPLLETSIKGATGVLVNVTAPEDVLMDEVQEVCALISEMVSDEANFIWGLTFDENIGNEVMITIVATGLERTAAEEIQPEPVAEPAPVSVAQAVVAAAEPVMAAAPVSPFSAEPAPAAVEPAAPAVPAENDVGSHLNLTSFNDDDDEEEDSYAALKRMLKRSVRR